jgi:hypothetical protein
LLKLSTLSGQRIQGTGQIHVILYARDGSK